MFFFFFFHINFFLFSLQWVLAETCNFYFALLQVNYLNGNIMKMIVKRRKKVNATWNFFNYNNKLIFFFLASSFVVLISCLGLYACIFVLFLLLLHFLINIIVGLFFPPLPYRHLSPYRQLNILYLIKIGNKKKLR